MNGRFLLDTNIVIALFAEDTSIQKGLMEAEQVFVSSIVLCKIGTATIFELVKKENARNGR